MKEHIVAILGSYRKNGIIHQAVEVLEHELVSNGSIFEKVDLLDQNIQFCTNCHVCNQTDPGNNRGLCPIKDDMDKILDLIDNASGLILASPINMYSTTALMKRFTERLAVYGYWLRGGAKGVSWPRGRMQQKVKNVMVITSYGMPSFLVRFFLNGDGANLVKLSKLTFKAKKLKRINISGIMRLDQKLTGKQIAILIKNARLFHANSK